MTALFTKHIKKHWVQGKFKRPFQKKDLKELTCYECQGKGHYAKNCPSRPKEESNEEQKPWKKKALVAAWGEDSDKEPVPSSSGKGNCLMENDDEASSQASEVQSSDIFESLRSCEQDQLVKIIRKLSKENATLQDKVDEQEEEISCLRVETSVWYKKLDESENALNETRNQLTLAESMHVNSSMICDKCARGSSGNVNVSSLESMSQVS